MFKKLMLRASLQVNLYMIREDHIFVTDVAIIDLTWEMVVTNVISQLASVV
jgi:hypothetical protein